MRKNIVSSVKSILTGVGFLGLSFFVGCNDDDVTPPFTGTIYELINDEKYKQSTTVTADKALDSLVKYLQLSPTLVTTLSGTTEFTFFAPSNAAFAGLLATPGFPAKISDINPNLITGVFSYHIVSGKLLKGDLAPTGTGAGLTTLYKDTNPCTGAQTDQVIKVNSNGTLLTGSSNAEIEIVAADNQTTENGVMHVTASVLIPPSIGASLTPILGKHTATISLGASFTFLAKAVTKADCAVAGTATTPIATMLAGTTAYTVFLPPNPVFTGTASALGLANEDALIANFSAAQWRGILLNHIIEGTKNKSAFTNGATFTTLAGTQIGITVTTPSASVPTGILLSVTGTANATKNAPILIADLAVSNGVNHVVGKILFP